MARHFRVTLYSLIASYFIRAKCGHHSGAKALQIIAVWGFVICEKVSIFNGFCRFLFYDATKSNTIFVAFCRPLEHDELRVIIFTFYEIGREHHEKDLYAFLSDTYVQFFF